MRALTHPGLARATLLGLVAIAAISWNALLGFALSDYDAEAAPAYAALMQGDVQAFLELAPAYGGSLAIRAPFAMFPLLWGGGELAVFRASVAPCLAAALALGIVLAAQRARRWRWDWTCTVVLLLAAANPITLRALELGHPEDLLGAALSAGAVVAALARRPWLAAVLLGLALANKAWAVLAIGPVLVALPERRLAAMLVAGAVAGAVLLPFALATADPVPGGEAAETGIIFQPWQVWWPLGDPDAVVRGGDGQVKEDWRGAPEWLGPIPHPLIAFLVVPLTALWWWRRARLGAPAEDALLLLALLFLLRCLLDPWNIGYYHLPFLTALVAWEALRFERPPVLTLLATVAVFATMHQAPDFLHPDAQFLVYMAWALPLAGLLAVRAFLAPNRGSLRPTAG